RAGRVAANARKPGERWQRAKAGRAEATARKSGERRQLRESRTALRRLCEQSECTAATRTTSWSSGLRGGNYAPEGSSGARSVAHRLRCRSTSRRAERRG